MVTSRDILNECRTIADELGEMQDQRLVFKSLAEKCTTRYSFAPVHTSDDVNKVFAIHRLVMLDNMIDKRKKDLERKQREGKERIGLLNDGRMRIIFFRRYIRNWSWKLIAEAMIAEHNAMSIRHLLRLHAQGMKYLDAIDEMNERYSSLEEKAQ